MAGEGIVIKIDLEWLKELWSRIWFWLMIGLVVVGLFAVVLMAACHSPGTPTGKKADGIEVVTVEGCEYLVFHVHGGAVLSHKGNCTNSCHRLVTGGG